MFHAFGKKSSWMYPFHILNPEHLRLYSLIINLLSFNPMMKRTLLLKSALLAVVVIAFTACEPESDSKTEVITFEDVDLGTSGYWNGSDLSGSFTSGILSCLNYTDPVYYSWDGFACSSKVDTTTVGYTNQYSVYASSGASSSQKFAVIYASDFYERDSALCTFQNAVTIQSLMVNNSTYVYKAIKEGRDGYTNLTAFEAGDYFYVTVTGFDENGTKTGSCDISLAEFRNGNSYVCTSWTSINLYSLGKVKSLSFRFTSSDMGDWGSNTPMYCCIDNIKYIKD
jgi:hypothetical protein